MMKFKVEAIIKEYNDINKVVQHVFYLAPFDNENQMYLIENQETIPLFSIQDESIKASEKADCTLLDVFIKSIQDKKSFIENLGTELFSSITDYSTVR